MRLLKAIANENFKDDDVINLIIGILKFAEIEKDDRLKIWGRFYSATIKIQQGMFQDSNDCALTILEYYDKMSKENKDMCIQLGIVAWAISQYRVGRETEGMLCMLASMHYIEKSQELLPFIEFGITIICDFIQKNYKLLSLEQKETLREIISKYVDLNIEAEYTKALLSNNLEKKVQISKLALHFVSEGSFEWRVAIVQTVDGLFALEKYEDAISMIISNAALIVESLAERKDIRPNKILNWLNHIKKSSLIHHQQDNKNTIYYLIDIALNDLEESRTVKHKAERAAIGEKINDLARIFLNFSDILKALRTKH